MGHFLLTANWKSHKSYQEAVAWITHIGPMLTEERVQLAVCPPFPYIIPLVQFIRQEGWPIAIGAQTVSRFIDGSHTGEVTAEMLAGWVDFVMVGHSERRRELGEDEEQITKQLKILDNAHIRPLFFTSEVEELVGLSTYLSSDCYVCYESPHTISTNVPSVASVRESMQKAWEFAETLQTRLSHPWTVLYGGSVTAETVKELLDLGSLSGVVVGQGSLTEESMLDLIKAVRCYG